MLRWISLVPPAIVVWSIVRRVPPALAIALSSLVAAIIGIALQGFTLEHTIDAAVRGFRVEMVASTGADVATIGEAIGLEARGEPLDEFPIGGRSASHGVVEMGNDWDTGVLGQMSKHLAQNRQWCVGTA